MTHIHETNAIDLHSHDAAPATAKSVAVIGLGNMGGAMAAHLIDSGFTTIVFDLASTNSSS
jgi:ketol-acid reductoisomerase